MREQQDVSKVQAALRIDSRGRRRYTARFKGELVERSLQPEGSVAGLAVAHGMNPNVLHRWLREARAQGTQAGGARLLSVRIADVAAAAQSMLNPPARANARSTVAAIEIRIADAVITIGTAAAPAQLEAIVRALR